MRKKLILLFTLGAIIAGFLINSCKKSADYLPTLLTNGKWQLATLQVYYYTGATQDSLITPDTLCTQTQIFQFSAASTCTYTNFDCLPGTTANGHWSFTKDHLFLNSDMVCHTDTGNIVPFKTARIVNLGQFSLVLQTGDLQTYYPPSQKRRVYQWGFVRVKTQ